jgi:hypothetical protein
VASGSDPVAIHFYVRHVADDGSEYVKKGRHRRFEEARALKRSNEVIVEPCAECGAMPGSEHASWCLAMEDEEEEEPVGTDEYGSGLNHQL